MARPAGHEINRDAWDDVLELTGRTAATIAEAADVNATTLRCIAAGKDRASTELAHKIARGAGVRPRTLFPTLNPAVRTAVA
jgi:DNA-binding XRE family transcriptional regulator